MDNQPSLLVDMLSVTGAVLMTLSVVVSMLILFNAIPRVCPFLSGFELALLGLLFVVGGLTLASGIILGRRRNKTTN